MTTSRSVEPERTMRIAAGWDCSMWPSRVAPSMPGIRMSETTTSHGARSSSASASAPLAANSISHSWRCGRSASRRLSSTCC
jgi:hypothetical protein